MQKSEKVLDQRCGLQLLLLLAEVGYRYVATHCRHIRGVAGALYKYNVLAGLQQHENLDLKRLAKLVIARISKDAPTYV